MRKVTVRVYEGIAVPDLVERIDNLKEWSRWMMEVDLVIVWHPYLVLDKKTILLHFGPDLFFFLFN